ncbi:hypothetical protein DYB37_014078 [Aphanomyces astaci]|uniref:IP5PC-F beta-propeller domain-containing protein n=1 Tax=Aphanomyces astaci TaxID=112090 RepID=A0A418EAV3_APHAT|nr:hypothetical protein DYB37_014078 [Aphanomyces astaci]
MSLCCFHAYVYSGSMDCTLLVWQLVQNVPVLRHRLTDFDAAVMAIAATTSFVVHETTTYDRVVTIPSAHFRTITFLAMDLNVVSNEVVSGDQGGWVIVWDGDTGAARRQMHVHACAITCLSFDSLRVVSGGSDGSICISDLVSGVLLQTLLGHNAKVLDLQLDRVHLVSASEDGQLRQWRWHTRDGEAVSSKRFHILGTYRAVKWAY